MVRLVTGFLAAPHGYELNRLTAVGLARITPERTSAAMQVSSNNPMVGIEGRTSLLLNLSDALRSDQTFFGADSRPGNLVGTDKPQPFNRINRLNSVSSLL